MAVGNFVDNMFAYSCDESVYLLGLTTMASDDFDKEVEMIFHTKRLVVRQIRDHDVPHLLEMNNDPDVMKYITPDFNPTSAYEEMAFIQGEKLYYKKHQEFGLWMVEHTDDTVGWISLKYNGDLKGFEIGYRFKKNAWHQGYATEIGLGVLEYAAFFNIGNIYGVVDERNKASIHVLEKLGMTFVKSKLILERHVHIYCYERRSNDDNDG